MDEQRKHAILFAATLFCARKFLPLMETDHPDPSQEFLTEHFRWRAVEGGFKEKSKRDFSLRKPTTSQERSGKKKSARSVRNDGRVRWHERERRTI